MDWSGGMAYKIGTGECGEILIYQTNDGQTNIEVVVLFFVIGFCSESIDVKEEMRFESILRMLIRLGLAAVFVQVIAGAAAYKAIH
jgi:hypothetical protein